MEFIVPLYHRDTIPTAKLQSIMKRSTLEIDQVQHKVKQIIDLVKKQKDEALKDLTKEFDEVDLDTFLVSKTEYAKAKKNLNKPLKKSLLHACTNITQFQTTNYGLTSTLSEPEDGILVGQMIVPLENVGIYIPGGKGAFPSTVLMAAIPANVAGVKKTILCTPPNKNGEVDPATLFAAQISGVDEVYKIGGAQAIAAMAFGTESIPQTEKIVGPGNVWVQAAKKMIQFYGGADIDFIAGPSEIVILADESANPSFVASDLLIEIEHGSDSAGIVITPSTELAEKVQLLVNNYLHDLPNSPIPRRTYALNALKKYGAIIVVKNIEQAIDFINDYSPEHLEIITHDPLHILRKVRNAGCIFLGQYSPSTVGCYISGVNHILPTGGSAKTHSPLSVFDFVKKIDFTYMNKEGLSTVSNTIKLLTEYEGFPQHYNAVKLRLKKAKTRK